MRTRKEKGQVISIADQLKAMPPDKAIKAAYAAGYDMAEKKMRHRLMGTTGVAPKRSDYREFGQYWDPFLKGWQQCIADIMDASTKWVTLFDNSLPRRHEKETNGKNSTETETTTTTA